MVKSVTKIRNLSPTRAFNKSTWKRLIVRHFYFSSFCRIGNIWEVVLEWGQRKRFQFQSNPKLRRLHRRQSSSVGLEELSSRSSKLWKQLHQSSLSWKRSRLEILLNISWWQEGGNRLLHDLKWIQKPLKIHLEELGIPLSKLLWIRIRCQSLK